MSSLILTLSPYTIIYFYAPLALKETALCCILAGLLTVACKNLMHDTKLDA